MSFVASDTLDLVYRWKQETAIRLENWPRKIHTDINYEGDIWNQDYNNRL